MIRAYARMSKSRPYFHWFNVFLTLFVFVLCGYQLLANEEIIFGFGFVFVGLMVTLFGQASSYRQKYLNNN